MHTYVDGGGWRLVQVRFKTAGNRIVTFSSEDVKTTVKKKVMEVFATATADIRADSMASNCGGFIEGEARVGDEVSKCEIEVETNSISVYTDAMAEVGAVSLSIVCHLCSAPTLAGGMECPLQQCTVAVLP